MKSRDYVEEIKIPEGTTVQRNGKFLIVSKGKNTIKREFIDPRLKIKVEGDKILIEIPIMTRKEKMQVGTLAAHIQNMIRGVDQPYVYKLKVCAGHFPMNISITGRVMTVKNYVGEKVPRMLELKDGVDVKIDGTDIIVTSPDKECAGQTASTIELLCRRPGFDPRIFQHGIYITEKAGKHA